MNTRQQSTARGMEAAQAGETEGLDPKGDSPVGKADAPKETGEAVPASPLTDEQIAEILDAAWNEAERQTASREEAPETEWTRYGELIARAIEHAHGIWKLADTGTTKEKA